MLEGSGDETSKIGVQFVVLYFKKALPYFQIALPFFSWGVSCAEKGRFAFAYLRDMWFRKQVTSGERCSCDSFLHVRAVF